MGRQEPVEIGNRRLQSVPQRHRLLPVQGFLSKRDIGLTLLRIVLRQRPEDERRARTGQFNHHFSQFADRELRGIAEIYRTGESAGLVINANEPLDQVVDVTERAGLTAVAVDRDRLALQRLHDEIRDDTAVVGMHARAIGIEDPGDFDFEFVLAAIIEEQRFGAALALIVAGARADRIDVAQ